MDVKQLPGVGVMTDESQTVTKEQLTEGLKEAWIIIRCTIVILAGIGWEPEMAAQVKPLKSAARTLQSVIEKLGGMTT